MISDKLKVAIYFRTDKVNTEEYKLNSLIDYCKKNNYEIVKVYTDYGYFNWDNSRKNYRLLLQDLENKKFNLIVTTRLFSLNASTLRLKEIFNMLKKYNCNLVCTETNYNFKLDYEEFMKERAKKYGKQ